jgi:pyruvate formate lyase activating enzyme
MPRSSSEIRVGGLARLSSVDWPGELAATIFTQGCPWDCPYCHNPHLLSATPLAEPAAELIPWRAVVAFLDSRVGLLDGVVFSGGEPLAQPALVAAIAEVREMGFRVALHTSGVAPARLAEVLPHLDWVGFDAKAPFAEYERITRMPGSGVSARESLLLLVASGVAYEVRTTVHPDLLGEEELLRLAEELRALGVSRWVLQPYRPDGARPGLAPVPGEPVLGAALEERLSGGFGSFAVRR